MVIRSIQHVRPMDDRVKIGALEVVTNPDVVRKGRLPAIGVKGIAAHHVKTILRASLARTRRVIVGHAQEPRQSSHGAMHPGRPREVSVRPDLVMKPNAMGHKMHLPVPAVRAGKITRGTWPFPIARKKSCVTR